MTDTTHELNFEDISLLEFPVTLGKKKYVVKEASADATVKYRNATSRAARMVDGKVVGVEGASDAEPLLVSMCLFEKYEHGGETKERPVLLIEVLRWPSRIMTALFDKIKEMTPGLLIRKQSVEDLEKEQKELQERIDNMKNGKEGIDSISKNLPSAMTDGSV